MTLAAWPWNVLFLSVKGSALIIGGHTSFELSTCKKENFLGISSSTLVVSSKLSSFDGSISCRCSLNFSIQR